MLKRLRAKHPIGFCVLSEVLFLGSLLLASYLIVFALVLFGVDLERVDSYFLSAVQEAVGMVVALVILGRTGKMYLLRRRGSGFFNGLLVGMYPLVLIGYSLYTKLMFGMPEDGQLQPAFSIFSFFLSMALVGVAEEFIFRGVIAQSLLERFGTGRAGVWKACLLSGLLFGAAHLTNLLSSAPFGVLMQCVFAASLGTLFAAIYFRTGNLWVTVFLHGAMDIASMLVGGLYGTEDVAESISGYDASMMLSILIYLIPTLFLLRKKKIGEVVNSLNEMVHGFDFAKLLTVYYRANLAGDDESKAKVVKWFRGEYANRTEARAELGVNIVITDDDWYEYIKLFAMFLKKAGYNGLLVLIDELVNIYKIPNSITRQYNYEKLLTMYNDTLQGRARHLGIIMGGTPQCIEDTRRGVFSYEALRSRLEEGRFVLDGMRNVLSPVIRLSPLTCEEMLVLIEKVEEI